MGQHASRLAREDVSLTKPIKDGVFDRDKVTLVLEDPLIDLDKSQAVGRCAAAS